MTGDLWTYDLSAYEYSTHQDTIQMYDLWQVWLVTGHDQWPVLYDWWRVDQCCVTGDCDWYQWLVTTGQRWT